MHKTNFVAGIDSNKNLLNLMDYNIPRYNNISEANPFTLRLGFVYNFKLYISLICSSVFALMWSIKLVSSQRYLTFSCTCHPYTLYISACIIASENSQPSLPDTSCRLCARGNLFERCYVHDRWLGSGCLNGMFVRLCG